MKANIRTIDSGLQSLTIVGKESNTEGFEYKNHQKLVITQGQTYLVISFDDIIYLQSHSNYTMIHCTNGKSYLVSRTLKTIYSKLNTIFVRVHHSYVVNLLHISMYSKSENTILLSNNNKVSISRSKKKSLLMYLKSN